MKKQKRKNCVNKLVDFIGASLLDLVKLGPRLARMSFKFQLHASSADIYFGIQLDS